ncbi:hypothetical protein [Heyndrickxia sp. FSL W8-0423]|uniref:hypothetical protein n=1 Tax=Heyndrickxia sp. FSL W8-0423 TaxID=2921601 RepID=UPI0030FB1CF8
MNIEQVSNLLNEDGIVTINTKNSLEEFRNQDENYYKLEFNGHLWEFMFVACEKNSDGNKKVLKVFSYEASASKYYYLFELSKHYFNKYIFPFESKNKDINIGEIDCEIGNLKEAFNRLNIDDNYFSFDGVKKEHSIFLNIINNKESNVKFIGENNKEIFETPVMDNWLTFYSMYKFVYYLYLLDKKSNLLQKEKGINCEFTDQDYNVFFHKEQVD